MLSHYVSLDLETTGLDPKKDKIIEIGAVKVCDGVITDSFSEFVNPGRSLTGLVSGLTGIEDEDLIQAKPIGQVIARLLDFIGEENLIGHSVLFDFSFTKRAAVNAKFSFEKRAVDTLKLARKYLPDLPSRSLGALCNYYEIPHNAHRALEDAKATHHLYQKLVELFYTEETKADFEPVALAYQVKREGPASKAQIERLMRIAAEKGVELREDPAYLTKNEASRITDLILSGAYSS